MLSNNSVLPNFVKTVLFTSAAAFSVSAFAGHHEEAEKKIGDLKDMSTETTATLTAEEAEMLDAKNSMVESKSYEMKNEADALATEAEAVEDEWAEKAETVVPSE